MISTFNLLLYILQILDYNLESITYKTLTDGRSSWGDERNPQVLSYDNLIAVTFSNDARIGRRVTKSCVPLFTG